MVWHECYINKLAGDRKRALEDTTGNRVLENTNGEDKDYLGLVWHRFYVSKQAGDSKRAFENSTGDKK